MDYSGCEICECAEAHCTAQRKHAYTHQETQTHTHTYTHTHTHTYICLVGNGFQMNKLAKIKHFIWYQLILIKSLYILTACREYCSLGYHIDDFGCQTCSCKRTYIPEPTPEPTALEPTPGRMYNNKKISRSEESLRWLVI